MPECLRGGRKRLKGAVYNLAQWCLSRNNDFQGYWAVGQLCRYAQEQEISGVCLDLSGLQPESASELVQEMCYLHLERFTLLMSRQALDMDWVKALQLRYLFGEIPAAKVTQANLQTRFSPERLTSVCCQVALQTDQGRSYQARQYAWVWPHDPQRELRRIQGISG